MHTIIFPSDYFNKNVVDPEFEQEYKAAIKVGFDVVLFNSDAWFNRGNLQLNIQDPNRDIITVLYRGWMMKPEMYEEFWDQLNYKDYYLYINKESYTTLHEFPNVYPTIRNDTAPMLTYPLYKKIDIEFVKKQFPKCMIKDYVKSVKGTDFPQYFDSNITQKEFDEWMEKFYQYRGNLLTGGICIKKYLNLKLYEGKTNEYRVFYFKYKPMILLKSSNQNKNCPKPPEEFIQKFRKLNSCFFTVDFAELEDGSWKIIECGDGQVSGIPNKKDINRFYQALKDVNDETWTEEISLPYFVHLLHDNLQFEDYEIKNILDVYHSNQKMDIEVVKKETKELINHIKAYEGYHLGLFEMLLDCEEDMRKMHAVLKCFPNINDSDFLELVTYMEIRRKEPERVIDED